VPTTLGEFATGTEVRLHGKFYGPSGALADPTTVTLTVRSPAGAVSISTYAASVNRLGVGEFYKDLELTSPGVWAVRWEGDGAVNVAGEEELIALRPVV
jgi:hypothetical protein